MKKLFLTGLSALMLFGVAGCGTNFDDTVKAAGKDDKDRDMLIYLDGEFASWKADANFQMKATSVKAVAEFDSALAKQLAKKSIDYLYVIEHDFQEGAAWKVGYYTDKKYTDYKEIDGNFAFKLNEGYYDAVNEIHVAAAWIPNPADTGPKHVEGLNSNVFVPKYSSEKDEHGMDWNANLVCVGGAGKYKVVLAKYTTVSTATAVGYGVGLSKVK